MHSQEKQMCIEIAKKYFNMNFDLPVVYCNTSRNVAQFSWYNVRDKNGNVVKTIPDNIEINMNYDFVGDQLYQALKHEVCHWACMVRGMKFRDGDKEFEDELVRIDAPSATVRGRRINIKRKKVSV